MQISAAVEQEIYAAVDQSVSEKHSSAQLSQLAEQNGRLAKVLLAQPDRVSERDLKGIESFYTI